MMRHNFPRVLCKEEDWAVVEEDHYHAWIFDPKKDEYRRLPTEYVIYVEGMKATEDDNLLLPCRTPCPGSGVAPFHTIKAAVDLKGIGKTGLPDVNAF